MKQLIRWGVPVLLVLFLAACGGGGGSTANGEGTIQTDDGSDAAVSQSFSLDFADGIPGNVTGMNTQNITSGTSTLENDAYLFDGGYVEAAADLGSGDAITIMMHVYIDDLREAKTVLLDSGAATGNIKLSITDNQADTFKDKDVALSFEVAGNSDTAVETQYRRFMEHEKEYLQSQDHERKVNQLWLHLAVTYDAKSKKADFYINGVHDSSRYFSSAGNALIDTLSIGSDRDGNHKYYGKMSNVVIEKKLLTPEEIYDAADFRKKLWATKYESAWTTTGTIYVDGTNGNDANDGSKTAPLATIKAAVEKINAMSNADAAGKRIVIKPGLYREGHISLDKSGSLYQPIVIEAETAGTVTIKGSEVWSNTWTETSPGSGIWTHVWTENYGRKAFQLPSTVDLDTEVRYHREIVAVDGVMARPYPSLERLENSTLNPNATTLMGDDHGFYVDETNDLIYLRSTKDPNSSLIEVGVYDGLFHSSGDFIVLRGLTFKHDASFENTYSATSGEAVRIEGSHLLVEDCDAIDNGSTGMLFSPGADLVVRGGEFTDNGRAGIVTRRGYANAYLRGFTLSYNHWRNDLGYYTGPDLSGYGKVMFSSRIYLEDATISHHTRHGIWFDAQNQDITLDNCYFTQNGGAVWFEVDQLNLGLINSSIYENNDAGVRVDSEKVYLRNNVMAQSNIGGAWGIISTLYYPVRTEQNTPDVYMGKWLTMTDNIIAVKSGDGKLMRYDNYDIIGANATSADNTLYAPDTTRRIYAPGDIPFEEWKEAFNDTTTQWATSYPFANDGTVTVSFESGSMSVDESEGVIRIPVLLSKAVDAAVTVDLQITENGATEGDDFELVGTTKVTFRPLERRKYVTVRIKRDFVAEGAEGFSISMKNPSGATLGDNDTVNVQINAGSETQLLPQEISRNAYNRIEAESADDLANTAVYDYLGFGSFDKYSWTMYQNVDFGSKGAKSVIMNIAVESGMEGRNIEVRLDAPDGPLIATVTTHATGSDFPDREEWWTEFDEHTAAVTGTATGVHDLYIVHEKVWGKVGVVDWIVFEE